MNRIILSGLHPAVIGIFILLFPQVSHSLSSSFTISGFVEDRAGRGLEGKFAAEIVFYDAQSSGTRKATVESTATVDAGVFSISVAPPPGLLRLPALWYSLAIDTNSDGLDENDLFDDRFRLTSVPFALSGPPFDEPFRPNSGQSLPSGPPVEFMFRTHDVAISRSIEVDDLVNDLHVAPFMTPMGGVAFDHVGTSFFNRHGDPSLPDARSTVGIYDREGNLVWRSETVVLSGFESTLRFFEAEGRLPSRKLFFTAFGGSHTGAGVRSITWPAVPRGFGVVKGVVVEGIIPDSFDPNAIVSIWDLPDRSLAAPALILYRE